MIIVRFRVQCQPGRSDELAAAFKEVVPASRGVDGVQTAQLVILACDALLHLVENAVKVRRGKRGGNSRHGVDEDECIDRMEKRSPALIEVCQCH